jgi:DNA-binding response OmpR family regulator
MDACVSRLRLKMGEGREQQRYVQTVRGFGYRFKSP